MNEADPNGVIGNWLAAKTEFQATHWSWYRVGTAGADRVSFGFGDDDEGGRGAGQRDCAGRVPPWLARAPAWGYVGADPGVARRGRGDSRSTGRSLRTLLDKDSKVVAQRDAEPADNLRPTTGWALGEAGGGQLWHRRARWLAPGVTRSRSGCTTETVRRSSMVRPITWCWGELMCLRRDGSARRGARASSSVRCCCAGQRHVEGAALIRHALGPDAAAVRVHDRLRDVQAEPHIPPVLREIGSSLPGRRGRKWPPAGLPECPLTRVADAENHSRQAPIAAPHGSSPRQAKT